MRMFWPSQRLDCLTTRYKHIKWHHRLWHLLQHHIAVILTPGEEAREGWHGVRGNSKSSKVRKHGRYFNVHVWNIWKLDSFTCNVGNFSAWKLNRWTDHYFRFYDNVPNFFCFICCCLEYIQSALPQPHFHHLLLLSNVGPKVVFVFHNKTSFKFLVLVHVFLCTFLDGIRFLSCINILYILQSSPCFITRVF